MGAGKRRRGETLTVDRTGRFRKTLVRRGRKVGAGCKTGSGSVVRVVRTIRSGRPRRDKETHRVHFVRPWDPESRRDPPTPDAGDQTSRRLPSGASSLS